MTDWAKNLTYNNQKQKVVNVHNLNSASNFTCRLI